jgi:hypothetical protein
MSQLALAISVLLCEYGIKVVPIAPATVGNVNG